MFKVDYSVIVSLKTPKMRTALTFNDDTRSAVSNSVNLLIWSTMFAIFGEEGVVAAAASVDCHRRAICCRLRGALEAANRRRGVAWAERTH